MLYLFSGRVDKRKQKVQDLAQQEGLVPEHVHDADCHEGIIPSFVSTQTGLFGDRSCYVFHNLTRELDLKKVLEDFAVSENIFIFLEDTVTKKISEQFEKHQAIIQDFGKEDEKKKEHFNIFALADAFGRRDKKNLWTLFQKALETASPEEIHGVLFWQVKNLALVLGAEGNPGMNNFVYTKNLGFSKNFSKEEVLKYSERLTQMFHERDVYSTLDIELERFILSL